MDTSMAHIPTEDPDDVKRKLVRGHVVETPPAAIILLSGYERRKE